MPEPPKKDEPKKKFMRRCVPHLIKKEGKSVAQARAICENMWKKKKGYEEFTLEVPMLTPSEYEEKYDSIEYKKDENTKRAVAVVGDRFMKGVFLPKEELKKVYKQWNGTFHDINHMGTNKRVGFFILNDIRYFVGYQNHASYNNVTNELSMEIHINDKTMYAEAWHGYVDLCEEAGKIPNVSVAFFGKIGFMKVRDLPKGVNYRKEGYKIDDEIPFIYDIIPRALSTVLQGACNDKDGCGIKNSCNSDEYDLSDEIYEERRKELIKELKEMEDKENV